MGKTIGLKQLGQKIYNHVFELDAALQACVGVVESSFDCIIYGHSGNGKSNFTAIFIKALIKALKCRCEYVAYEEGHAATIQETFIGRHNMLEELGNAILLTDHYTFDELRAKMRKKQSAKIWVLDSLQAARFTNHECAELKREFVLSRKQKIIIYVSQADGQGPKGAAAKDVEYMANIKLKVDKLVVFPKTRYEKNGIGNKPFVIYEKGAREKWGDDYDHKVLGHKKRKPRNNISKPKKKKDDTTAPIDNSSGTTGSE
jgi:hypothetical protein